MASIGTLSGTMVRHLGELGVSFTSHKDDLTAADLEGWVPLTNMSIITGREKEINKLKNMGSLVELIQSRLTGG